MSKKREEGKERKNFLRGLSGNYVDGVCEGVYASHVQVNIDGDSDRLRCAWLKHGA
jgi:hypothetical protein